jgi:Predicted metal-dependent membrane protease
VARVRQTLADSDEDGLLAPLPWRSNDGPAEPLSGPGGTELTTLDESDYPDPPTRTRPDGPDGSDEGTTTDSDDPPDPSETFPISGEAEYTDPGPSTEGRDTSPRADTSERSAGDTDGSTPEESTLDEWAGDGEPLDRTGRGDRWDDTAEGRDRWTGTDTTPEDRWSDGSTDTADEVGVDERQNITTGDGANEGTDDTVRPGVATATPDPEGMTPGGFDDPDPFAGATDGFDPQLPSERDGVRVGGRELSTTVLLANVVGSQLLFAGLLAAVTVWAAVPAPTLGLGSVTPPQAAVGALLGVGLWVASESGGRLSRRVGVDPAEALRGALAPTTRREWWFLLGVVLPVVAVFEEFLFRAVLVGAFAAGASATGLSLPAVVFVVGSSVAFGLAHSAQGHAGMAVTGLLGVVLATAFVLTDSLVVVIVAHYVVNAAEFLVHEGPVSQFPGG